MAKLSQNCPRNRRPFVQLDLQNIPQHCSTEFNFRSLSPEVEQNLNTPEERAIAFAKSIVNQTDFDRKSSSNRSAKKASSTTVPAVASSRGFSKEQTKNIAKPRRRLPPIPLEYETLLRQQEFYTSSTPTKKLQKWCKKLSNNMNLEIESDPLTGKTLFLRLINSDRLYDSPPHEIDHDQAFDIVSQSPKPVFDISTDSGLSISCLESPNSSVENVLHSHHHHHHRQHQQQRQQKQQEQEQQHYSARSRFVARHSDELDLEPGDGIDLLSTDTDHWSEGVNRRTGRHGIFPSLLAAPLDEHRITQQLPMINFRIRRERYLLDFLGSIEVAAPKGESIVSSAIEQIILQMNNVRPCRCTLEISDIGLRMLNAQACLLDPLVGCGNRTSNNSTTKPSIDYFFSLLQITYCGYQRLSEDYYFAFITRHPSTHYRYACHVFRTTLEMANLAEAVGRAFHRFYNRFVEVTLPLETILDHSGSENCFV